MSFYMLHYLPDICYVNFINFLANISTKAIKISDLSQSRRFYVINKIFAKVYFLFMYSFMVTCLPLKNTWVEFIVHLTFIMSYQLINACKLLLISNTFKKQFKCKKGIVLINNTFPKYYMPFYHLSFPFTNFH